MSLVWPRCVAGVALLATGPASGRADEPTVEVAGLVDLRYAHTDTERSGLDGGPGKLRYGAGVDGRSDLLCLAQLSLVLDAGRAVRPALGLPLRTEETLLQASWRVAF